MLTFSDYQTLHTFGAYPTSLLARVRKDVPHPKNVTPRRVYEITKVESLPGLTEFTFVGDDGKSVTMDSLCFEEPGGIQDGFWRVYPNGLYPYEKTEQNEYGILFYPSSIEEKRYAVCFTKDQIPIRRITLQADTEQLAKQRAFDELLAYTKDMTAYYETLNTELRVFRNRALPARVAHVTWDAEDPSEIPNDLVIPANVTDEEISDWLSDQTGYCHLGYTISYR